MVSRGGPRKISLNKQMKIALQGDSKLREKKEEERVGEREKVKEARAGWEGTSKAEQGSEESSRVCAEAPSSHR